MWLPQTSADASAHADYTIWYKPSKDMVLANHLSCFPLWSNNLPIPHSLQCLAQPAFKCWTGHHYWGSVEYNLVCIAPSTTLLLEDGLNANRMFPALPDTSGATRDELSIESGLLLKGTRVCIPLELLDHTLADLQGTHQGIDRMQAEVQEAVYWPGIDTNIVNYVCQCTICTKHKASLPPSQCFLGMYLMAPGRKSQQTT